MHNILHVFPVYPRSTCYNDLEIYGKYSEIDPGIGGGAGNRSGKKSG